MHQPTGPRPDVAFVIRIHRDQSVLRGQVVAVADGATRLFEDLDDAMAFIRERVGAGEPPAAGAGAHGSAQSI